MAKTLIRTFRDNMLAYGYPEMDIEELMSTILSRDEFQEEFKAGSIIPGLTTAWLQAKGIRYKDENFSLKSISRRDMQQLARLLYDTFEDLTKREADWYAHQAVGYVSQTSYWRDASIRPGFLWYVKLNLSAFNIAEEDIDEAWHEAFHSHYASIHDKVSDLIRGYM